LISLFIFVCKHLLFITKLSSYETVILVHVICVIIIVRFDVKKIEINLKYLFCTVLIIVLLSRYYLMLRFTKQSPREFVQRNKGLFDVNVPSEHCLPQWIDIGRKLEKEMCTRPITIAFTGQSIRYMNNRGDQTTVNCLLNRDDKVWLVLELYGISVHLDVNAAPPSTPSGNPGPLSPPLSPPSSWIGNVNPDVVDIKDAIRTNFVYLKQHFHVDEFLDHLFNDGVITEGELSRLAGTQPPHEKVRATLMFLMSRPVSKTAFIKALTDTKQEFLIEKFFPNM